MNIFIGRTTRGATLVCEGKKGLPLPDGDDEMCILGGPYFIALTLVYFDGNRFICRAANWVSCNFASAV